MPSLGPLLRDSFAIFARYPLQFAALASINVALGLVQFMYDDVSYDLWLATLWTPAVVLVGTITGAAVILIAASARAEAGPHLAAAVRTTFRRLKDVVEFTLRHFGATVGLAITVIGIPWAVRILVRWTFGTQAVVLNRLSAKEAISESCRLVEGRWWRIALLSLLLSGGLAAPQMALMVTRPDSIDGVVIRAAIGLTLAPVLTIFWTLLFLRLRETTPAVSSEPSPAPSAP